MPDIQSLYIERSPCGNCYRCVRECEVKAISTSPAGPEIVTERCVACGDCLSMCRYGYVRMRDDVHLARRFIKNHTIKVASVAPDWMVEFEGIGPSRFVEAMKLLGFTHVSESSLGAEATMKQEKGVSVARGGLNISPRCPVVADYIARYKPRLASSLLPVPKPYEAHAQMIRSWWGHEAHIIHFSSCIALKRETERGDSHVELALTFRELRDWMHNEGVDFDKISGNDSYQFEPFVARHGVMYPLEGHGIDPATEITVVAGSGMAGVVSLLDIPQTGNQGTVYLDLMACHGGCLGSNGRGSRRGGSLVAGHVSIAGVAARRLKIDESYTLPAVKYREITPPPEINSFVAESETLKALASLGLSDESQQIDCNACGYVTCRRFAKALSKGAVTREMCIHYVQSEMSAKFTTLLGKLSAGIAVVDSNGNIVEANRMLATMLGSRATQLSDSNPGMKGVAASEVMPFAKLIGSVLENGNESVVRDVQVRERILTVSIHSVQKHKTALVICRNMHFSQVRNEEIVRRTQKVIDENLETVQKIAHLLGENASRTEAILNSILDAQTPENG